ncbi:MAG TPA: hypothetical protein VKU41_01835, partial [Polyangiaceae bacterium]|nr:hypothetical protein [Polyangiaceae bacterium]
LQAAGGETLDALLLDEGMLEVVAARLETRAESARTSSERAALLVELARLCAGPLADDPRAVASYAGALAADPSSEDAVVGLRGVLGQSARALEAGSEDARGDPLRAAAASMQGMKDEGERYAWLLERLARAAPQVLSARRPVVDGSDSRRATARAWVRASLAEDARAQAAALERVAGTAAPKLKAVLLSTAAERYLACEDVKAARQAGEAATQADPSSARSIASLANVVVGAHDRVSAAALERAIVVVGPRVAWCFALGEALDALGEPNLAVAWSQRCVALRPGDPGVIEQLLERLLRAGDADRIGDALAWLLSQPLPFSWLAGPFAAALTVLAGADVDRAAVVARRALDVFGPKSAPLREAMLEVARKASDDGFAASIFERWLSCGAEGTDRRQLLGVLADVRHRLGDDEGVARIIARAVAEGVTSPEIEAHVERLANAPLTPDAQLWRLAVTAERLSAGPDAQAAAWAWRDLAAARWDLADDRVGAVGDWLRAARTLPAGGHAILGIDLVTFGGADFAFEYLSRLIETEPDDATAAGIAADVARAALSVGEPKAAFDLAARGLARNPAASDALQVAERAAPAARELPALSALYALVARRALGRFGRRAAHYRGARFFERCGENTLALQHAAQAFFAVPSEGSSFQLLARAAERADDCAQAVRTVEQVAQGARRAESRAGWLLRAASIAGSGQEGARRRLDALLGAMVAAPTPPTVSLLFDAARGLMALEPDERELVEMRLARAARVVCQRTDGPLGARLSLAVGRGYLDVLADATQGLSYVARALDCDGNLDDYADFVASAEALGRSPGAGERLAAVVDASERVPAAFGTAAWRLVVAMTSFAGDPVLVARASIAAALRDPDDDGLILRADAAIRAVPGAAAALADRLPVARRASALLAAARKGASEGAYADAAGLFERAGELVGGDERAVIERELRAIWAASGRGAEIEAQAQRQAASDSADPSTRADRWMEVAERREGRGDLPGAVRAVLEACALDPLPLERWSALERVSEAAGDESTLVQALEEIASRVGVAGRAAVYKRLARAHERRLDFQEAESAWLRVLDIDPKDEEADAAVESR